MGTTPTSQTRRQEPGRAEADARAYAVDGIERVREMRGMTVAEVARRSQMNPDHLGKVMRGERALRFDEGIRVCSTLDIDPLWLIPPVVRERMERENFRDEMAVVPRARRGGRPC